ncbi:Fungal-trans domain-containing protein [Fusarium keratoplasticum]|uniref:Fungal-trans domain-containing protein n=1 Tax=Fusarium keratoplasticum TaxID=1328300 RepID=A0ACC0R6B4_9HYPO|nr:Fungal-trans domain-containing protein [Fusarium keratoplasticum]KAI8675773.1 Fungal-trans domain-containing protein [Fusarium keratoplasticum]
MDGLVDQSSRLACASCRSQKRKCTRELPSCHLCRKNGRPCVYPGNQATGGGHQHRVSTPSQNTFPALFFLDSFTFKQRGSTISSPPASALPQEFLQMIGKTPEQLAYVVDSFFAMIHPVFPIVSKRTLYQQISSEGHHSPDIILLLQCMEILLPNRDEAVIDHRAQYRKAKQCLHLVEDQGIISMRVLQAALLLSLYEAGHAIFPAAFLSIGHCARIGHAIGIHDRRGVSQMFPSTMSWTATEEIRRTWWGVIILDRFINIGLPDRPFASIDACPEDLLPMDEILWDLGEQTVVPSLAVSSSTDLPAPPLARTCQAAHLLSRVLSHIGTSQSTRSPEQYYSEALQLHGILSSFKLALDQEVKREEPHAFLVYSPAQGLCFSAIIALCDNHTCADLDDLSGVGTPEQLKMQETALNTLHEIGASVWQFASHLVNLLEPQGSQITISPFAAQCLYAAATQYQWYIEETGKVDLKAAVDLLKHALGLIGRSWKVGEKYCKILEGERV